MTGRLAGGLHADEEIQMTVLTLPLAPGALVREMYSVARAQHYAQPDFSPMVDVLWNRAGIENPRLAVSGAQTIAPTV